jgi:hypothetical protein
MPGNHEGDCKQVSRQDLLEVVRVLPGCVIPPSAKTFDYAIRLVREDTPSRAFHIQLLDATQNKAPYHLTRKAVE